MRLTVAFKVEIVTCRCLTVRTFGIAVATACIFLTTDIAITVGVSVYAGFIVYGVIRTHIAPPIMRQTFTVAFGAEKFACPF